MIELNAATKRFVVVDAWVIGKASTNPLPEDNLVWKAASVLSKIIYVCHKVVLDIPITNQENILDEYRRQATSDLTKWWFIAVQREEKMVYRPRAAINISVLTDPDDLKYFQVAFNSPSRTIISEDSDLASIADDREVTDKGITVWTLDDALASL